MTQAGSDRQASVLSHRSLKLEPLLWLLFSAGGVMAALLIPALVFLFGLAFPLGWLPAPGHDHLLTLLRHPLARVVVFLLPTLSLFHWAHRFRYTLYDGLQIKHLNEVVNLLCYGGATVGSAVAGYLAATL
jgi:fumarate reductase subunit D